MAVGYCASCGMRMDLHGNMCAQCGEDMRKCRKKGSADFPLTLDGVIANARRRDTCTALAFLAAASEAIANGIRYGW